MRVLVVDEELPFPVNTGKRIRTFNLLKHLAAEHDLTFISRLHAGNDGNGNREFEAFGINTHCVAHPILKKSGAKFYFALLANLFSLYPYSVSSHYSAMMVKAIGLELARRRYDLIHCEWTPYAVNLQPFRNLPSVVDAHNVEALIWKRNAQVARNPAEKAYLQLQWKKMERFERHAFKQFKRIASVSQTDKDVIAKWVSPSKVAVIENGVDTDYFHPSNTQVKQDSLVFTGSMDWRPNVDAMMYFLDHTWPLVLKANPRTRLTIVGRNPLPALRQRAAHEVRVHLTGTVDDVRPYVAQASVFIVPLRVGGGSRLKILEALAMKKAVVSTSVGAEGLELMPGKDIAIADRARDMAGKILELLSDEARRRKIAESGYRAVVKAYQWRAIAAKLNRLWYEAVQ